MGSGFPVVASADRVTRDIVIYSYLTVAATLALWPFATGWVYGVLAAAAGVVLLSGAAGAVRDGPQEVDGAVDGFFHLAELYQQVVARGGIEPGEAPDGLGSKLEAGAGRG